MLSKLIGAFMLVSSATGSSLRSSVVGKLESSSSPLPPNSIQIEIQDEALTLCEVEVFDKSNNKIVLSMATQTTSYGNGNAEKAIDGDKTQNYFGGNGCSHTLVEKNPTWHARFEGKVEDVAKVVIYNRIDSTCQKAHSTDFETCQRRLDGALVRLNNRPVAYIEHADDIITLNIPAVYTPPTAAFPAPECKPFTFGQAEYNLCKDYATRAQAAQKCQAWGGELAVIESAEENVAVTDAIVSAFGCVPDFPLATAFWDTAFVVGNQATQPSELPEGILVHGPYGDGKFVGYRNNMINNMCHATDKVKHYMWTDMADWIAFSFVCKKPAATNQVQPKYIGCFKDDIYNRDLPYVAKWDTLYEQTLEEAAKYCLDKGYTYMGRQWKNTVFCGNSYGKHGASTSCTCDDPLNKGAYVNCVYELSPKADECEEIKTKYTESSFCQNYKWGWNQIKTVEGQSVCDCMKACEETTSCVSFNFNEAGACALKSRAVTSARDSKEGGPCSYAGGSYTKN